MTDIIQLERDLTDWAARLLGLTMDSEIFRGGIPESAENGVGVMITANLKESAPMVPCYRVQVLGRFEEREAAQLLIEALAAAVPAYEFDVGKNRIVALEPDGFPEPYRAEDRGRVKTYASVNLICRVR